MNDAAVRRMWANLEEFDRRISVLERKVEFLKGQVKARLKEEAATRNLGVTFEER